MLLSYLKLLRVKHYIKNLLIFFPIVYAGYLFDFNKLFNVLMVFLSFSLVASIVYIFNDIMDLEFDRLHDKKKNRPIASGKISKINAYLTIFVLLILIVSLNVFMGFDLNVSILLMTYLLINILYTFHLKKVPIIELFIVVAGFILRVIIGGVVIDLAISNWLFLTVLTMALYLAIGKRRNELKKRGESYRLVLSFYNQSYLDKFLYVSLTMTLIFYSLWTVTYENIFNHNYLIYTIPLVIIITMKYSLNLEDDNFGDPSDVLFNDPVLLGLVSIYVLSIMGIFYPQLLGINI